MLTQHSSSPGQTIEYIRYRLPPDAAAQLEVAYQAVGGLLTASPNCLAWELARGVEDPGSIVIRIEWDSIEGHEQGFRESPEFPLFFETL